MTIRSEPLMEVIIQEYQPEKSNEQRNFWHLLLGLIADETGYTKEEVKELVKKAHLGTKVIEIGGIEKEVTESSESLAKTSYADLIDYTYRLAAEAEIVLPAPKGGV